MSGLLPVSKDVDTVFAFDARNIEWLSASHVFFHSNLLPLKGPRRHKHGNEGRTERVSLCCRLAFGQRF